MGVNLELYMSVDLEERAGGGVYQVLKKEGGCVQGRWDNSK